MFTVHEGERHEILSARDAWGAAILDARFFALTSEESVVLRHNGDTVAVVSPGGLVETVAVRCQCGAFAWPIMGFATSSDHEYICGQGHKVNEE